MQAAQDVDSQLSQIADLNKQIALAGLALNPLVAANPAKVAAAAAAVPGDNGVALKLIQLQDKKVLSGAGGGPGALENLNEALANLASGVGSQAKSADDLKSVCDQALSGWQAVSGVNMDEELSSMMTLQHAYQAAARVPATVDLMMDTIIKMGV